MSKTAFSREKSDIFLKRLHKKYCGRFLVITNYPQNLYQLLQLCSARTVFSILVTVRLYTVMPEVCRWLTNEKQRKTDSRLW